MSAREVAIVLHSESFSMYGVRVRERAWHGFWWKAWRKVDANGSEGFKRPVAEKLAEHALLNGWVETYAGHAEPLIGKDMEG